MSNSVNSINMNMYRAPGISMKAQAANSAVENPITAITDKIDEVKERKHNKAALKSGIIAAFIIGAVALLNPRYSKKLAETLQKQNKDIIAKIESTKNNKFVNKIYKIYSKVQTGATNFVNFVTNLNPVKDIWFKNLCTEEREFLNVKNLRTRRKIKKIDKHRVSFMTKMHRGITKWFDGISKFTVKNSYKRSGKQFDKLEEFVRKNLDKMSAEDRRIVEDKLLWTADLRKYCAEDKVTARLNEYEGMMENLERDFMRKLRKYGSDFNNKWIKKSEHIANNLYYWPEEIMRPTSEAIEKNGEGYVEKLIGDGSGKKGYYGQINEILSRYLDADGKKELGKLYQNASKSIRKASKNECTEYFGKKRDLILGSAPTDVLTAVTSLGVAGIAVTSADDKNRRMSKLVTAVVPVIAGVGVSIGLTAMLVSGGAALLYGLVATGVLNRLGIVVDKYLLGNKEYYEKNKNEIKNKKEVDTIV